MHFGIMMSTLGALVLVLGAAAWVLRH